MNDNQTPAQSSHQPPRRQPVQISLGFILITMVIFSIISAGLFYSSRVPAVLEEISVLTGVELDDPRDEKEGRSAHLRFIMFTIASPLILAGVCSAAQYLFQLIDDRQTAQQVIDE